jgi:hypothetical protein
MFAINTFAQKNVATCEIIFFYEYYFVNVIKKEIQMCFSSNGLEFCVCFFTIYA